MLGLAFASVPLYRLFCAATGFAGTPARALHASAEVGKRIITVRFNADTAPGLAWDFHPEKLQMKVHVGENALAFFVAKNETGRAVTGHAVYNVVPEKAGAYFVKVQCFCFTNQTLKAHAEAHMPVSFYIDPQISNDPAMDDVTTITLSYTFFTATSDK